MIPKPHETSSSGVQSISTFGREDADRIPGRIQHVVPAPIRTHLDGDPNAITLRIIHQSHDPFELAAGREALDAG